METPHRNESPAVTPPAWTLADVLSSFRYWAFVLAVVVGAITLRTLFMVLPLVASKMGATYEQISSFSAGNSLGWVVGGLLSLLFMPRRPKLILALPLAGFALGMVGLLVAPGFWAWGPYLILLGTFIGAFSLLSLVAAVSVLASGRLSRPDMVIAFALPALLVGTMPEFLSIMLFGSFTEETSLEAIAACLLAGAALALIALTAARPFSFDGPARDRHQPMAYRRRSSVLVALIAFLPIIFGVIYALSMLLPIPVPAFMDMGTFVALRVLFGLIALGTAIYVLHWIYRIHGEIAGQAASRDLLSPLAAVFIWLLVPLGFVLVLVTLGRVLGGRTQDRAQADEPGLSGGWLAFWCIVAPPVAMGMIQHAANRRSSRAVAS